ncbi:hypothetical protein FPOAC2_09328 [Fusarium poae]|jgi:hypothetical protein
MYIAFVHQSVVIIVHVINAYSKPVWSSKPRLSCPWRHAALVLHNTAPRSNSLDYQVSAGTLCPDDLDRELGVSSSKTYSVDNHSDIGSHNRQAPREAGNRP